MNFFEQQEHARRQSRKLVFLFALAVLAIVAAVNAALALVWSWTQTGYVFGIRSWPRGFFATNTGVTLALIAGGSMIELFRLRDGGDAVARMAGGRPLSPTTTDLHERRLLNVVDEMAIASGIAAPRVYLLDAENGINAFAAGYNQEQAVIALTRGALLRLNRDELQGVVAHEFSHVLNGDMRLNIRLIGLLFGIQMLAGFGRHLIDRAGSDGRRALLSPRLLLLLSGAALLAVGYIGVFFGRLIKAAVSRQREFLADASAVRFTRSADGIGGALRKIAGLSAAIRPGSRIAHPNAEHLSHLFLAAPRSMLAAGWLATHPPVEERLRRIYGRAVPALDATELPVPADPSLPDIPYQAVALHAAVAGQEAAATASATSDRLPQQIDAALREPQAACELVCAMLLAPAAARGAQLRLLPDARRGFVAYLADTLARLPKSARLPVLDLAMPALSALPVQERDRLLATVARLIAADGRLSLAEFVLQTVLARRLSPHAGRPVPVRYDRIAALGPDSVLLLSLVAHVAAPALAIGPEKLFAAGAARCSEAGLSSTGLMPAAAIDYPAVSCALERAHRLAPLAKPLLIKALMAAAGDGASLPPESADLMRAICAALEAPVPAAVSACYPHFHW